MNVGDSLFAFWGAGMPIDRGVIVNLDDAKEIMDVQFEHAGKYRYATFIVRTVHQSNYASPIGIYIDENLCH